MNQAGTINFRDATDSDEAAVIIRYDERSVAVCRSKKSGGEMEVLMDKDDAKILLKALQKAVA